MKFGNLNYCYTKCMDEESKTSVVEVGQGNINESILNNIDKYVSKRRTICEVIREVYDLTFGVDNETMRDEIRLRLRTIYEMAKKMDKKLHEYKYDWDENFWEENRDYAKDLERRTKRYE